ncbi:MAG: hypothetical protein FJW23_00360 [Acidimicrobiia bacterium]|nr:hypothetical protein [Acidimicrobiia bacterium]
MPVRRARGRLLRLVLNRPLALAVGVLLMIPAVWLLLDDFAWESGVTDGVALLLLATGAAVAWTGLTGRRGDWVDSDGGAG